MSERRVLTAQDLDIEIPKFTFRPNVWTEVFLTGLQQIPVENKRVVEMGVGSGIVGIELLKRGVKDYIGIDIDKRVLPVAQRNIVKKVPQLAAKVKLLRSDLLASIPQNPSFDLICGCLPQVGKPSVIRLGTADSYARYFNANRHRSALNVYGLGLNESALRQARSRLKKDGGVALVLSGRPGRSVLESFFATNGYKPRLLFEDTIPQLRETTLETLVQAEENGYEFFFFKDPKGHERITVREAEERRKQGLDSYHKIYVFEGKPKRTKS